MCIRDSSNSVGKNIAKNNTTQAGQGGLTVKGSILYNSGSDNLYIAATTSVVDYAIYNNIFYGATGYNINFATAGVEYIRDELIGYNAFGNASTANTNNLTARNGDVTLTADPFTNAASNDYTLNSTAGGGADCKDVGFPLTVASITNYIDLGALQLAGSSGERTSIWIG